MVSTAKAQIDPDQSVCSGAVAYEAQSSRSLRDFIRTESGSAGLLVVASLVVEAMTEALRELSEAATPGPWGEGLNGNPIHPRFDNGRSETVYPVATGTGADRWVEAIWVLRRQRDAAFIVAAVNYVRSRLTSSPENPA